MYSKTYITWFKSCIWKIKKEIQYLDASAMRKKSKFLAMLKNSNASVCLHSCVLDKEKRHNYVLIFIRIIYDSIFQLVQQQMFILQVTFSLHL